MLVEGVVSSEALDADGEVVLQDGLDFGYFLEKGWINNNHEQGAEGGIGVPLRVSKEVLPNGRKATRLVAEIFDTAEGRKIWDLAKASSGKRSLGFSIEGSIVSRQGEGGKTVAKARVRDAALTRHPKNPDATIQLVKSLTAATSEAGYNLPGPTDNPLVPQSLGDQTSVADRDPTLAPADAIRRLMEKLGVTQEVAARLYARLSEAKNG